MIKQFILLATGWIPKGHLLGIGLVAVVSVVAVGGTAMYQRASQANHGTINNKVKPAGKLKDTGLSEKKVSEEQSSPTPEASTPTTQSAQPAPVSTVTKQYTQKPAQTPATTTPASIVVGGLTVGTSSSMDGVCRIPISTSVKTNFNGSVTLYFATAYAGGGQADTYTEYVVTSPGAVIPVQRSISIITPGSYTINVTMSVGSSSYSPAFTGPVISYSGSTTGATSCTNY